MKAAADARRTALKGILQVRLGGKTLRISLASLKVVERSPMTSREIIARSANRHAPLLKQLAKS